MRSGRTNSQDARRRDLQLEARAHIAVQKWIDEGGLKGRAVTTDGIRETYRRFCELLPEDLLFVEDPHTHERIRVVPGELRLRDVEVGRHLAVSPGAVPRFLERFGHIYGNLVRTPSSRRPPPITACSGFTRSSTATAVWLA